MRATWQFTATLLLVLLNASCSRDTPQVTASGESPTPVTASAASTEGALDMILINGQILTVDADFSVVEALAITNGRISAVGTTQEISALATADTRVNDLAGRTVVPGLIDNHNHFVRATEQWYRQVRWDEVTSRADALAMLRQRAADLPAGEWVVVLGGWIPEQFTDSQSPFTRAELDALLPGNPVYIQQGYGRGFANSLALEQAGLVAGAELANGVEVVDGELTGVLNGAAAFLSVADRIAPTPDAVWDESLQLAVQDYLAQGLTTLLDIGGNTVTPRHYEVLRRAAANDALDLRVFYTLNGTNGVGVSADEVIASLESTPARSGDDFFGQFTYGEMTFEEIRDQNWPPTNDETTAYGRILVTAAARGWQIHEHSTRDDKMQATLDLMEQANATTSIAPLRWTLAHAEQASDATIARAKDLGVAFALHSSGGLGAVAAAANGADVSRVPPIRQIEEAGVIWGLGSDGTVVSGYHPFQNIGWAVSGLAKNGEQLLQATVSREAALRAHTFNNAWLLFKEDVLGSLEPGKYADLVVLDRDYMAIPAQEIALIKPVLTMVNGEIVYTAP
jgi:predicted amidohydrolase YtcJ